MSIYTIVVEFPEGREPAIGLGTDILGGRAKSIAFFDYRDDFFTIVQRNKIENVLEQAEWDGHIEDGMASEIMDKIELLTK